MLENMNTPFAIWVKTVGRARAAEMIGCSLPSIDKYRTGERRPSAEMALKIEQVSGGAVSRMSLLWPADSKAA